MSKWMNMCILEEACLFASKYIGLLYMILAFGIENEVIRFLAAKDSTFWVMLL